MMILFWRTILTSKYSLSRLFYKFWSRHLNTWCKYDIIFIISLLFDGMCRGKLIMHEKLGHSPRKTQEFCKILKYSSFIYPFDLILVDNNFVPYFALYCLQAFVPISIFKKMYISFYSNRILTLSVTRIYSSTLSLSIRSKYKTQF